MRRRRISVFPFMIAIAVYLSLPAAHGQKTTTGPPQDLLNVLPSAVTPHADALGERVLRAGKERTALVGQLVDERGERVSMRVTLQLPRMVGLEGLRPNMPAIVSDGRSSVHSVSKTEGELLEIFSSDTAEAMLAFVKEEAAIHVLGRRVKASGQGTDSPLYDIYEVVAAVPSGATTLERLKRYSFDSGTGLLARTEYLDETYSPPVAIEIRFSDWQRVEDSAYPGRLDRLENGRLIFSWIATRIQVLPRQDPSNFGVAAETGQ